MGTERAVEAGLGKVNALVTVSETYSKKNQNMSVEEILDQVEATVALAHDHDVEVEAGGLQAYTKAKLGTA